ncbi:MAG: FIVAR domain-containing protein, partial [Prevotella sp.]|nr:FIVAR domain-containing protein [Prevotella sp.]
MKKILFLLAVFCLTQADTVQADTDLTAYSNVIYVAPASVAHSGNGSETTLYICMNNTAAIRGFQFDMYLPEGMTAVKTSKGKFDVSLNAARLPNDDEHTLTVAEQGDGAIRFLCASQYDETFTGTWGEIATIKVKTEGMAGGNHPITLKAIKLSETDISKYYEIPEVVTTFTVRSSTGPVKSDTDYNAYSNVIYVPYTSIDLGVQGSETALSICMNNTAAIRGFQFDLYLPEGMTAVKTSKGKFDVSLNAARLPKDDEHTLTVAEQGDGAIRFLCASQYDETFTGSWGEIATIKVNTEGMAEGEYPITLKAIKLSETDISKSYEVSEIVTTFTVGYTKYLKDAWIQSISDQTYTGEALEPTVTVMDGETMLAQGTHYTVAYSANTNAGTATVTVIAMGGSGYTGEARATFTIAKADITVTAPVAAEGLMYSGEAQTLITAGVASFGTVLYSLDGETYSEALPTATEAGTYTVYYKVEGDDNHNAYAAQAVSVTIATNKTALNSAISEAEEYYDTIKENNPDAAATLLAAIDAAKTVQANSDATQQEIETAATNLKEVIEVARSTKADITMTTAPVAVEGLVYTGEAQTLITAGVASFGTVLYSLDGETYSEALPTATEAGTYTIYYKVEGDDNHNAYAAQAVSVTIATNKTALNSAISEAEEYYDTIKESNPDAAATLLAAIDAAKTVQANSDATQQEIETAATNLKEAIEVARSTKADITMTTAPVAVEGLVYTGEAQTLITAGVASFGTVLYSLDGETYSEALPTATEAGTYT